MERVEVKDVRVPEQLMRAMAAEAEAAREARAKVIAAEGEHKSSRALMHAAENIVKCPVALQVLKKIKVFQLNFIKNPKSFLFNFVALTSASLPSNSRKHCIGEQQHHCVPNTYGSGSQNKGQC